MNKYDALQRYRAIEKHSLEADAIALKLLMHPEATGIQLKQMMLTKGYLL